MQWGRLIYINQPTVGVSSVIVNDNFGWVTDSFHKQVGDRLLQNKQKTKIFA